MSHRVRKPSRGEHSSPRAVSGKVLDPDEQERLAAFADAVRPKLAGDLRLDRLSRSLYATDASMYQVEPLGVLTPKHREDVLVAVEAAADFRLPVLPRGAGSSLAGSSVGTALVIDTTLHLDGIVNFDREARQVTVEPGVILDQLNAHLAGAGLRVGPDPASSNRATLGGMVGTNATGARSIRYGSVIDHLVSARAVLPDGTPIDLGKLDEDAWRRRTRGSGPEGELFRALDELLDRDGGVIAKDTPRHWRRAGGYRLERLLDPADRNPAHLLCGSEGTLAFLTEVTLGLVEVPSRTALGVAHFPSRQAALEAVAPILETDPSAVELFDRIAIDRARDVIEYRLRLGFIQGNPGALLIVEYEGETDSELGSHLDGLERVLGSGATLTRCMLDREMEDVWAVRKVGLGLAMSARLPVQCLAFIEDAAVPVAHLPEYVRRLERVLKEQDTDAVMYAHASAGCLHVRPFLDTRRLEGVERMEAIARASADLVKEYGGIISSEHGDGLARSWLASGFYGDALYRSYRDLKRAFDPDNRFNPGRVVEAPPMTKNLRTDRKLQTLHVVTEMDWSATGGLAGAAEACNGQGVCRKHLTGTMCPSFMVTREEGDSTRGRANALRNVFSGALPPEALTGPELREVMDLCISCKACRSECPAAVDMAAMKAEWQAMRWRVESPSIRTRMIANQPRMARRLAGSLAPVANALMSSYPARRVLARFGFAEGRQLPPFARRPFREREASRASTGDPVILFADTFARFHEPEIPRAALRVLEAAGYSVTVPAYRCCGRTLISKGFLGEARRRARALIEVLHPFAAEGHPVVGLEPSCLLTLRDEAPRLLPEDPRANEVATAAVTFEEFVAAHRNRFELLFRGKRRPGAGRPTPPDDIEVSWMKRGPTVLLHGHCHQKAFSGMAAASTCLEVAGFDPRPLDAGCCGMAGSFGYEAEHEEVSRQMAERVLAPAIREAPVGTRFAAAGTSCRHQIADCAGRPARHPAEHLADRLSD